MNVVARGSGLQVKRIPDPMLLLQSSPCSNQNRPGRLQGAQGWLCPGAPHVSDPETFCFQNRNILFTRQKTWETGVNRTLQDRGTDTHPPVCCRATSGNYNCSCRGDRDLKTSCLTLPAPACQRRLVRSVAGHTPGMRTPEVWQSSACLTSTSLRRQFRSRSGAGDRYLREPCGGDEHGR